MATREEFDAAVERVQKLPKRPSDADLLELYGLFKQATVGDVQGKRPGMLNVKGRAKWDAWKAREGTSAEDARDAYVKVVERLEGKG
ncbi:MAG TPA: acyl-CoA-binding protein [Sandaracinaceae bacterium LLY-WYZ-13_1]|nr:acyl-CoA-binding protein [Sandaracinaceae bacterium LLY-WYZ-13_1]